MKDQVIQPDRVASHALLEPSPSPSSRVTEAFGAAHVIALQRSAGNAAVTRYLRARGSTAPRLQRHDVPAGAALPHGEEATREHMTLADLRPAAIALLNTYLVGGGAKLKGALRQYEAFTDVALNSALNRLSEAFEQEHSALAAQARALDGAKVADANSPDMSPEGLGPEARITAAFLAMAQTYAYRRLGGGDAERDRLDQRKPQVDRFPPARRAEMAAALRQMPTVRALLADPDRRPSQQALGRSLSAWNGASQLDDLIILETDQSDEDAQIRTHWENGDFSREVRAADDFIRTLVEPQLLATIKPPPVHVHTKAAHEDDNDPRTKLDAYRFRSIHNRKSGVHVAQDEFASGIVHEVGHYLEAFLPSEIWADLRSLLRQRHASKGGKPGDAASAIPGHPTEGRFEGDYPATGNYTSKAYATQDTEVMSMTLEFLKHPAATVGMIDKDPLQAAIVLRGLRPEEYARVNDLRPFDAYLPSDPGARQPRWPPTSVPVGARP
jgi:hypothetical protein